MAPSSTTSSMLVFSAHAADFVWRAGGAIALYALRGCRVRSNELMQALVQEYRTHRPELVLTHSYADPYNPDHPAANSISLQARVYAQAEGYPLPGPALGAPSVFMFEPHQPEQCGFRPEVLLDVTPVWEKKRAAMESMEAQSHLVEYYSDLSRRRGSQAVRNSGRKEIQHAEAFERVFPQVTSDLA